MSVVCLRLSSLQYYHLTPWSQFSSACAWTHLLHLGVSLGTYPFKSGPLVSEQAAERLQVSFISLHDTCGFIQPTCHSTGSDRGENDDQNVWMYVKNGRHSRGSPLSGSVGATRGCREVAVAHAHKCFALIGPTLQSSHTQSEILCRTSCFCICSSITFQHEIKTAGILLKYAYSKAVVCLVYVT